MVFKISCNRMQRIGGCVRCRIPQYRHSHKSRSLSSACGERSRKSVWRVSAKERSPPHCAGSAYHAIPLAASFFETIHHSTAKFHVSKLHSNPASSRLLVIIHQLSASGRRGRGALSEPSMARDKELRQYSNVLYVSNSRKLVVGRS